VADMRHCLIEVGSMDEDQNIRLVGAKFITSVFPSSSGFPKSLLPEVAFVGRSNVGKSSLINALVGQRALAISSKTPGRTQSINFYEVRYKGIEDEELSLLANFVDLPGYGYAKRSHKTSSSWIGLAKRYFDRNHLSLLLLLVDARRGPEAEELQICSLCPAQSSLRVVLTKADQVSRNDLKQMQLKVGGLLEIDTSLVFATALTGKKRFGMDELSQVIARHLIDFG